MTYVTEFKIWPLVGSQAHCPFKLTKRLRDEP